MNSFNDSIEPSALIAVVAVSPDKLANQSPHTSCGIVSFDGEGKANLRPEQAVRLIANGLVIADGADAESAVISYKTALAPSVPSLSNVPANPAITAELVRVRLVKLAGQEVAVPGGTVPFDNDGWSTMPADIAKRFEGYKDVVIESFNKPAAPEVAKVAPIAPSAPVAPVDTRTPAEKRADTNKAKADAKKAAEEAAAAAFVSDDAEESDDANKEVSFADAG